MDEEIKNLLKKNLEISEESLKISQKLYRAQKVRWIYSAIKWLVIIVLLIVGFIQIQPYLESFAKNSENILRIFREIENFFPTTK